MSENVWLCLCVLVPEHEYAWFMRYERVLPIDCVQKPEVSTWSWKVCERGTLKKNGSWNAKNVTSTSSEN